MRKDKDPTRLVRFVLISAADGIAAGWLTLLALLWLDVGGLGSRVHGSANAELAVLMLAGAFAVTFSYIGIVWGVMVRLPDAD
jgi:hypothetical protein